MTTHTGFRAVHGDFTSSHGYRWPYPGQTAHAPLPEGREFSRGDPCPQFDGDGLCVAMTWRGAASGGISAATCLIVEWDDEHVLGSDENKVRVSQCRVVEVLDVPLLARAGYLQDADLRGAFLGHAILRDANLQDANLRDANLRDVNLQDADLRDAYLWGVDLRGAYLWGVEVSPNTVWPDGFDPAAAGTVVR